MSSLSGVRGLLSTHKTPLGPSVIAALHLTFLLNPYSQALLSFLLLFFFSIHLTCCFVPSLSTVQGQCSAINQTGTSILAAHLGDTWPQENHLTFQSPFFACKLGTIIALHWVAGRIK